MENTLERIAKCRYKTTTDKHSGFWQVDLTAAALELLAFLTPKGRVFHLGFYGVKKSQNQLQSEILLFLSNYTIKSIFSGVSPPPKPPNWNIPAPRSTMQA